MLTILIWTIIFCLCSAASITLVGHKDLIGDLSFRTLIPLLFNWRFILAMVFALGSRISFTFINSGLYKIPKLAGAATTIAAFITIASLAVIVVSNALFLGDKISTQQMIGMAIIIVGIIVMLS
jgi:uncharacterized membrane protein